MRAMRPGIRFGLSAVEKHDVWSRWKGGQTLHEIGRVFDKPHSCIRAVLPRGGIPPVVGARGWHSASLSEKTFREESLRVDSRDGQKSQSTSQNGEPTSLCNQVGLWNTLLRLPTTKLHTRKLPTLVTVGGQNYRRM